MVVVDPDLGFRLTEAVTLQSREEPDMYLVSREGDKLPTHRSVMGLFSPVIRSLVLDSPQHVAACVILPDSSYASLCSVVGIFYSGVVPADLEDKDVLAEIEETCDILGLHLKLSNMVVNKGSTDVDIVSEEKEREEEVSKVEVKTISKEISNDIALKDAEPLLRKCDLCEYTTKLPINIMKHYSVDHFEVNLAQLTDFYFELNFSTGNYDPCKVCNKVLVKNTLEKNTHKKVVEHIGVFHMKILDILKSNKIDLSSLLNKGKGLSGLQSEPTHDNSIPLKTDELKCEMCSSATSPFTTKTEFQDHLSGVHFWTELVGEYGNKYSKACSLCKFKFQTLQQLAKHIGTIHNKVLGLYHKKKEQQTLKQAEVKFSCSLGCAIHFSEQTQLLKHYAVSHFCEQLVTCYGSYESQCTLCFAWLNTKTELAVHIGMFHGKVTEMLREIGPVSPRLDEELIRKILPTEGSMSNDEEMLVKKMIEKSKKLIYKNLPGDQNNVNISMKR